MRNSLIGWQKQAGAPLTEAMHSVAQLDQVPPKLLLTYGPVARMNPYQALLYRGAHEAGVATSELIPLETFREVPSLHGLAHHTAVHFHWINSVIGGAKTTADAKQRVKKFLQDIDEIRSNGVGVVFTIHNKVSHDAVYVEEELSLQQGILDRSTVVHSMTHAGIDSMQGFADIDTNKVVISPHPTYQAVYPDYLPKSECRRALGIRPDEFVISFFGAIKPYKGLNELRKMWQDLERQTDRRMRLIIAGSPDGSAEAHEFLSWASKHPSVVLQPTKIPFEQVQLYVKAADAGVIPYRRTLNSGAAMLHLTFGNPIICVDEPALYEGLPRGAYYKFEDSESFSSAVSKAVDQSAEELTAARRELRESRSPSVTSEQFMNDLLSKLGI